MLEYMYFHLEDLAVMVRGCPLLPCSHQIACIVMIHHPHFCLFISVPGACCSHIPLYACASPRVKAHKSASDRPTQEQWLRAAGRQSQSQHMPAAISTNMLGAVTKSRTTRRVNSSIITQHKGATLLYIGSNHKQQIAMELCMPHNVCACIVLATDAQPCASE